MKAYESLNETLSFYGVRCDGAYYISSGEPIIEFPKKTFRMDFYAFCICVSGSIDLEIDNQQYSIARNGFLVSAPSTIIKFVNINKDFRMKVLFFDKTFLLKNMANPFFIEKLSLFNKSTFSVITSDEESALQLFALLNYLQKQSGRKDRFIEDIIRTIIINLLLETATLVDKERDKKTEDNHEVNSLFLKFHELLAEHISSHKDVQFYADRLFITNKYLIVVVKRATGKTPHDIINNTLLKEALVLLGNPEKTISQIASEIGFSSTSSFGRFFKKYVSLSPQEYRRQQHI